MSSHYLFLTDVLMPKVFTIVLVEVLMMVTWLRVMRVRMADLTVEELIKTVMV